VVRASPGSADLAVDEERTRPDAGRPEFSPLIRTRDEQLTLCSMEEEVRITARQQARGRVCDVRGAHGRLVAGEQPLVAEWRSHWK
jgi:hypothetical protein